MSDANTDKTFADTADRQVYQAPTLTVYGSVSTMTAAGSGPTGENPSSNNPNRRP
ncbi:hypothetical protein [Citreimonas sp.]|uniref:hypothetical protein n=1 Tax=Citreimonas sp. TaxID=3036715 RepID=UPI0035C80276